MKNYSFFRHEGVGTMFLLTTVNSSWLKYKEDLASSFLLTMVCLKILALRNLFYVC